MAEANIGDVHELPTGEEGVVHDRMKGDSGQTGASMVAAAEQIERDVDASRAGPEGQRINKRRFLELATAGFLFGRSLAEASRQKTAAIKTTEEQPQTPGRVTVDLPLHVKAAVGPLLAWAGTAKDPKVKERRVVIGCLVTAVVAALGGAGLSVALSRKEIKKKVDDAQEFKKLPLAVQQESIRRDQAEQASQTFQFYKDGRYKGIINPWDVRSNLTRQLMGEIGPTWMFVPERQDFVNFYLGEEFTGDQIAEFRINPQKREEFFKILEKLKNRGKITQEVVDFYQSK